MNSFDHLHHEFDRLAGDAPDDGALRAAVTTGITRREKRRRTTALVAVAASVTLVVGGVGITRALTAPAPSSTRPAAPPPVVAVPDVPLPADTQLIRHQLQPVVSPVSATPPEGLTDSAWMNSPGRLTVWWYHVDSSNDTTSSSAPRVAGYVVTDSADDPIRVVNASGLAAATVDARSIMVGEHRATLELGPADANDKMGMPAEQRISWQLADGRTIRVFVNSPPPQDGTADPALLAFAETVTEKPTTLLRTVGIGLTLPGLVADASSNVPAIGFGSGGSLLLCPEGLDPYAQALSGSGSASSEGSMTSSTVPPPDSVTVTGSASAAPGEEAVQIESDPDNPFARCITVFIVDARALNSTVDIGTPVTVAGTTVRVDTANNAARVTLNSGLVVALAAPPDTPLSADDLAALAASVRVSPDVKVPDYPEYSAAMGTSAVVTASSEPATPLDPSDPTLSAPIALDPTAPVTFDQDEVSRTVTVGFTLENVTSTMPKLTKIELDVPGYTVQHVRIRPENEASDAVGSFQEAVLPAVLAPHARVRVQIELLLGDCSETTSGGAAPEPRLQLTWENEAGAGSSSGGGTVFPLGPTSSDDGTSSGGIRLGAC